jgi:hypothetical protein
MASREYPATWRKHASPVVKTEENKSGSTRTSKAAMDAGKARMGWDKRGQAISIETVPGANWKTGTPSYIKDAAKHAEGLIKGGKLDCGYGKQDVHRSHRESLGGEGKPDVKKDKSYRNPTKETP